MVNVNKEYAIEANFYGDLDSTINYLIDARNKNENIYIDFGSVNGVIRFYSSDITEDNAYLRIYGLTKEQYKAYEQEMNNTDDKKAVTAKYKNLSDVYFDRLRDDSTKLEFESNSLSEAIKKLNECKKLNKNVYIDFRSTEDDIPIRFFSMDINIDDAFMKVMGITKAQYDENKEI